MNLLKKERILPIIVLIVCVANYGIAGDTFTHTTGLHFIAIFAALFYGSINGVDLLGRELEFLQYRRDNSLGNIFPIKGKVLKTVTLSGENDWHLIKLNRAFQYKATSVEHVLVKRSDKLPIIPNRANQLVHFKLVPDIKMICEKENDKTDFPNEVWALCQ